MAPVIATRELDRMEAGMAEGARGVGGTILNIRGIGGSGKTELARRILRAYGWPEAPGLVAETRPGRRLPIAYRLPHPLGGRPLAVIGHYERTCGGCDTIRAADGGLPLIFGLAAEFAAAGHDVLLEGLVLSREVRGTAALAERHATHLIRLATPPDACAANLAARRRLPGTARARLEDRARADHAALLRACAAVAELAPRVRVAALPFDPAQAHVLRLLGLEPVPESALPGAAEPADLSAT